MDIEPIGGLERVVTVKGGSLVSYTKAGRQQLGIKASPAGGGSWVLRLWTDDDAAEVPRLKSLSGQFEDAMAFVYAHARLRIVGIPLVNPTGDRLGGLWKPGALVIGKGDYRVVGVDGHDGEVLVSLSNGSISYEGSKAEIAVVGDWQILTGSEQSPIVLFSSPKPTLEPGDLDAASQPLLDQMPSV